ncbi:MAG: helix-turn-helix transcriptional regulator, partial [Planctomycetaceae bacterium]
MTDQQKDNRVRERRTALGLTQAELAERAGISRTAVTAIEGERLVPSVVTALAIAEVLGGTAEELFGRGGSKSPTERWVWQPSGSPSLCWRA